MLGALIGVGANLVTGAIDSRRQQNAAKRERKQAVQDEATKFVRLREAAEAGGFNPLTALQYNFGSNLPSGVAAPLSISNMFEGGVQAVSDWATGKTAAENQRQQLEDRLLELEIERVGHELANPVPYHSQGGGFNSSVVTSASSGGGASAATFPIPFGASDGISNPYDATQGLMGPDTPYRHTAENYEAEYGEIGGLLGGVGNMIHDSVHTFWTGFNDAIGSASPMRTPSGHMLGSIWPEVPPNFDPNSATAPQRRMLSPFLNSPPLGVHTY